MHINDLKKRWMVWEKDHSRLYLGQCSHFLIKQIWNSFLWSYLRKDLVRWLYWSLNPPHPYIPSRIRKRYGLVEI